jgi:hypothetical protein
MQPVVAAAHGYDDVGNVTATFMRLDTEFFSQLAALRPRLGGGDHEN